MSKNKAAESQEDSFFSDEDVKHIQANMEIKNVKFSINEFLGIMKNNPEFKYEDYRRRIVHEDSDYVITTEDAIQESFDEVEPMTAIECLTKFSGNDQKMMVAISTIGAEKIAKGLEAEVISEQTIKKTQMKAFLKDQNLKSMLSRHNTEEIPADAFEKRPVEYEDTYRLYKVSGDYLKKHSEQLNEDLHIVECVCPSKGDTFFLFVPADDPQCQTAFGAIAWTLKDDSGKRLSVEEWKILAEQGEEC